MKLLREIKYSRNHEKKDFIPADEFIEALESDFGRELDKKSKFFYRHHEMSVQLLNKILTGKLKSGDAEQDNLILQTLLVEAMEYAEDFDPDGISEEKVFEKVLIQFSKSYPDAGNILSQAIAAYFKKV